MKNEKKFWNVPNRITMYGFILAIIGLPLLNEAIQSKDFYYRVVSVVTLALAASTDYFDGRAARKLKQETEIGAFLDGARDKLLLVGLLFVLVLYLKLWWWFGALILIEFFSVLLANSIKKLTGETKVTITSKIMSCLQALLGLGLVTASFMNMIGLAGLYFQTLIVCSFVRMLSYLFARLGQKTLIPTDMY